MIGFGCDCGIPPEPNVLGVQQFSAKALVSSLVSASVFNLVCLYSRLESWFHNSMNESSVCQNTGPYFNRHAALA